MNHPIGLGVIGMGRAFTLMLPTWTTDPRIRLIAAHDPRPSACLAFQDTLGGTACQRPEEVCAHPDVEWVYIASPHAMHVEHVLLAARYGKHVLVEKPMALNMADCEAMIKACEQAGTHLVVGHSHSFDAPVRLAQQLIASGQWGHVRMIQALQYTDFLYRPRRPEELQTALGGGVVFSQAAHQVDVVRLLAGTPARTVRAITGAWDARRPTEGAYSALLTFDGGVWASLTYSGYGFFDTDVWMNGVGELGAPKSPSAHSATRRKHAQMKDEAAEAQAKAERNFGGSEYAGIDTAPPTHYQHFGPVIVSCENADLQLLPNGVMVMDASGAELHGLAAPTMARQEVVDEIWAAARLGQAPQHDGKWSMATLEVCLALLESSTLGRDIMLRAPTTTLRS
jgi:phthalate 4,5-cis-dihydrodiol dehydrogenase